MRRTLRVINVLVWLALWLGVAIGYNAFGNFQELLGEAIIPAVLCIAIDGILRRQRRVKNSN